MRTLVAALAALAALFLAVPAYADEPQLAEGLIKSDAPVWQPAPGGFFVNDAGNNKLNGELASMQFDLARLGAENVSLRKDLTSLSAAPLLTWKAALILVGVGLLVGTAASIPIALVVARK